MDDADVSCKGCVNTSWSGSNSVTHADAGKEACWCAEWALSNGVGSALECIPVRVFPRKLWNLRPSVSPEQWSEAKRPRSSSLTLFDGAHSNHGAIKMHVCWSSSLIYRPGPVVMFWCCPKTRFQVAYFHWWKRNPRNSQRLLSQLVGVEDELFFF